MSRADLARNLRDPKVHTQRAAEALLSGVGTTFLAPAKMKPWQRRALHGLSGAAGAGGTAWVLGGQKKLSTAVPAAGAVSAVLVGLSVAGAAIDGRTEQWLRGRGVKRPRALMGLAVGLLTLVVAWADDLADDVADEPGEEPGAGASPAPAATPNA